jgi:acetolactate synthase-1/2/3 large subunit
MQRIQEVVVRRSDAVVMADAGNAFAWATHCLSFDGPGRFRVSTGYGSMGHFSAGVIGAAVGLGAKAVSIVGDGALLMNNELSTAATIGAPAVWIVLNDARFGMVEQGMRGLGMQPVACEFPQADFAAIARAVGCDGVRVHSEHEIDRALEVALAARGPFVVDVLVDSNEPSPVTRRVESLMRQIRASEAKEGA